MILINLLLLLFHIINAYYYPYLSNFKIQMRKSTINPAINFMNLNNILNSNNKNNKLNISYYNKNKSILFKYNTFSELDDYKYYHSYLLKNTTFFIIKYNFNIDFNNYRYLLLIKSNDNFNNRLEWNIIVKYNNIFINKNENDKILLKLIKWCIYKKSNIINPILKNYFNIKNNL